MGSQLLLGFSMRLTFVLVFTTLGIEAKADPKPVAEPLTVKAHVAVKVKSGSSDCNDGCSKEFDPRCGTDGVTYGNPCLLELEACKHQADLAVAYHGECKTEKGKTGGKHSGRWDTVQCDRSELWAAVDEEEVLGEVGDDGERVISYCAKRGSDPGERPYYQDGPGNWYTGNYVNAAVQNFDA